MGDHRPQGATGRNTVVVGDVNRPGVRGDGVGERLQPLLLELDGEDPEGGRLASELELGARLEESVRSTVSSPGEGSNGTPTLRAPSEGLHALCPACTTSPPAGHQPVEGMSAASGELLAIVEVLDMNATPLLCEFHAHTTWSDGELSVRALVDLYGRAGFDVLAVTDHVVRPDDPYLAMGDDRALAAADYDRYLDDIEAEAERARRAYGLLVIPGFELTYEDRDARRSAHALALGVRTFVGLEDGLDEALATARGLGAALIGAHPYTLEETQTSTRSTARFAVEPEWAATVVDRLELCNRHDFFPWVAEARLPVVATGDFHRPAHLTTWKTVIQAEKTEPAVLDWLRSTRPAQLTLVDSGSVSVDDSLSSFAA